jgi:hypothetical protein
MTERWFVLAIDAESMGNFRFPIEEEQERRCFIIYGGQEHPTVRLGAEKGVDEGHRCLLSDIASQVKK